MKLQITIDGIKYELEVEAIEDEEVPHHPNYGMSYPLVPSTVPPTPAAQVQGPAHETAGNEDKLCRSPITGMVIKTNVVSGQTIQEHELIVVLEAMKMETNVIAPRSGKVKNVLVAAGDSVKMNQVIVELE
jgi:methylmalonyl-CoA carboxyltransferase small subunit